MRRQRAAEALQEAKTLQAANDDDAADDARIRALAFGSKNAELAQWALRRHGLTIDELRKVLFAEALPDVELP